MFKFGAHSRRERSTLHPFLSAILGKVLETDDFAIVQGARSADEQAVAFKAGFSKVDPSKGPFPHMVREDGFCWAADIHPFINGQPLKVGPDSFGPLQQAQFAWFLRKVKEVGLAYFAKRELPYALTLGIDWNDNNVILADQSFQDWFHVEMRRL